MKARERPQVKPNWSLPSYVPLHQTMKFAIVWDCLTPTSRFRNSDLHSTGRTRSNLPPPLNTLELHSIGRTLWNQAALINWSLVFRTFFQRTVNIAIQCTMQPRMMNLYYHVTDVVKRHIDAASRRFSMLTMISVKQMSTNLLTHMDSNVYTIFAQCVKVTYTEIHTHTM